MTTRLVQPPVKHLSRKARFIYNERIESLLEYDCSSAYKLAREHGDKSNARRAIDEFTKGTDLLGKLRDAQGLIQLTDRMPMDEILAKAPTIEKVKELADSFDPLQYKAPRDGWKISRRGVIGVLTLAVAAAAGGDTWHATDQEIKIPDIKRSPSGKTLYQIVEPYVGSKQELSDADAKEIISLTSGRYFPISTTFNGTGIEFKIWDPRAASKPHQEVYLRTRGNPGSNLASSTTLADILNRVVIRDDDSTIKSIVVGFIGKNYGVVVSSEDVLIERTGNRLLHDVKYVPGGKPTETKFSTPTGHINFLGNHVIFVPYLAMKPN